jgi:serine/threonine protein kinase
MRRDWRASRAVAALNHPGIAVLYEIGEFHGTRYLAMEYVEGATLQEQLTTSALSKDSAVRNSIQVADALEHANGKRILHRDTKAANIIVTREGRVKLLDFGLAMLLEDDGETRSGLTAPGTWMGTPPHYCAGSSTWSRGFRSVCISTRLLQPIERISGRKN